MTDSESPRRWVSYNATISFVCEAGEDTETEHAVLGDGMKAALRSLKGRMPSVGATGPARSVALTDSAFTGVDPDDGTRALGAESESVTNPKPQVIP